MMIPSEDGPNASSSVENETEATMHVLVVPYLYMDKALTNNRQAVPALQPQGLDLPLASSD